MWGNSALEQSVAFGFINKNLPVTEQLLNPSLISNNESQSMLVAIQQELRRCDSFIFSVAFITSSALAMLKQVLADFDGRGEIITSRYLDFNEPAVFEELLLLPNVNVWVHDKPGVGFHAKGYIFHRSDSVTAIIGSSNLTDKALKKNREWNLKFSAAPDGKIAEELATATFEQLRESIPLTTQWIREYEETRNLNPVSVLNDADNSILVDGKIQPNLMQTRALEQIALLREAGERRAVVISATGTGKTILAALALKEAQPKRGLFIAHREQILIKAKSEFARVLECAESEFGLFAGARREIDKRIVFATVQSLSRPDTLASIDPAAFDFVMIDEVHRSGAASYRNVIDYLEPNFLLGLTATPERTDDFNVFELFDFNVPYEIRLQAALEEKMLVPFHYFGVTDYVDSSNQTIDDTSQLSNLILPERVKYIVSMLEKYGFTRDVKGLMFCSTVAEAKEMSDMLNEEFVHGKKLKTQYLAGSDSIQSRELAIKKLADGELDYILSVDIFNEGIDIPSVNQVVMLRNTQSSIIFTQQLGRGLRKFEGKDHLRVIDFIGNYKNNYLIPIALFGENSRNKDRIREHLIENKTDNSIAGISSINFDQISQARILKSIEVTKIDSLRELKSEIQKLVDRLNRIPRLMDFVSQDTTDPVLMAKRCDNYLALLHKTKFIDSVPPAQAMQFLNFLSAEILPGKRPHELLLLELLLRDNSVSRETLSEYYAAKNVGCDEKTLDSVERVLSLRFYKAQQQQRYGKVPVVVLTEENVYRLSEDFERELRTDVAFRESVKDIVQTGLFLARHHESWSNNMKVGNKYARREVCRLLNFKSNEESTVYGYKVDEFSKTCPIFVTYHKGDEIADSVKYEDQFLDLSTLHWFTRSNRTFQSGEVQKILSGDYELHLFVKKDDAEGNDFYYLGQVRPSNEIQTVMPNKDGDPLSVVTMNLSLDSPVEQNLFDYLNTSVRLVSRTSNEAHI
ncbi:DUF3427 domain-containing protein [Arcanobacterium ihumii]|uniref:DUF3427 domain-containing protein n=1 Tax=Arcanobacterium ihumii TaxID=2138162 RepID=UPI00190F674E|nr:DEAD/DEAH box helicase [Arcanobacterium ihumii]